MNILKPGHPGKSWDDGKPVSPAAEESGVHSNLLFSSGGGNYSGVLKASGSGGLVAVRRRIRRSKRRKERYGGRQRHRRTGAEAWALKTASGWI
jgi:hypothetical protein